jgi:hypothetical protein
MFYFIQAARAGVRDKKQTRAEVYRSDHGIDETLSSYVLIFRKSKKMPVPSMTLSVDINFVQ